MIDILILAAKGIGVLFLGIFIVLLLKHCKTRGKLARYEKEGIHSLATNNTFVVGAGILFGKYEKEAKATPDAHPHLYRWFLD